MVHDIEEFEETAGEQAGPRSYPHRGSWGGQLEASTRLEVPTWYIALHVPRGQYYHCMNENTSDAVLTQEPANTQWNNDQWVYLDSQSDQNGNCTQLPTISTGSFPNKQVYAVCKLDKQTTRHEPYFSNIIRGETLEDLKKFRPMLQGKREDIKQILTEKGKGLAAISQNVKIEMMRPLDPELYAYLKSNETDEKKLKALFEKAAGHQQREILGSEWGQIVKHVPCIWTFESAVLVGF